jgi:uncharacterized Zn finger protein (UPF0148 family)
VKEFPCKNCLVKSCCTSACDKVTNDTNVISFFVGGLKICPDCGENLYNLSTGTVICFSCKKAFKETIKKLYHQGQLVSATPNIFSPPLIIVKSYNTDGKSAYEGSLRYIRYSNSRRTVDKYEQRLKNEIPNKDITLRKRSGVIFTSSRNITSPEPDLDPCESPSIILK